MNLLKKTRNRFWLCLAQITDGYVPFKLSCRFFCGVKTDFMPVKTFIGMKIKYLSRYPKKVLRRFGKWSYTLILKEEFKQFLIVFFQ